MRADDRGRHDGSFQSILFRDGERDADVAGAAKPDCFGDLNLDQVVAELAGSRPEQRLEPYFYLPLRDEDAVRYRHEVCRELERREVREPVERFVCEMRRVREHLVQTEQLRHRLQQEAWLLDAIGIYSEAVAGLAAALDGLELQSRGLRGLRAFLGAYVSCERFRSRAAEAKALHEQLAAIEYAIHIQGGRVTVEAPAGQADYSAEVKATFARFEQRTARSYRAQLHDFPDLNHVETRILELVAKLHRDLFARLAEYCERERGFLDPIVSRFDREVQVYLAYLDLAGRLTGRGLRFCYPQVSAGSPETTVCDAFDLALALKADREQGTVVTNDLRLREPERIAVVTGPNNGGKTTFARMVGQLHHLASLGLPVPGSSARLLLPDRVFTLFEREEEVTTLRGKFEDELVRARAVLEQATAQSVVILNETFSSTTLEDARAIGARVLRRLLARGSLGVYVTFVDELASLSEATVSLVAQVVPGDPAQRTFKVVRTPADGRAYAWAIAEKYGLTYERLLEAIPA
jgi:DNA mismatch repair protein MutS